VIELDREVETRSKEGMVGVSLQLFEALSIDYPADCRMSGGVKRVASDIWAITGCVFPSK